MQYWLPGSHKAMFAFTTQHVDIEFPERTSDCPEPKNFQKKFPQKNTSQYPWQGEEIRDSLGLKRFCAFMVKQCTVLWCGRNLWVETVHSHLPCFALCRKTTPNKQRAAKPYKMAMNWVQITQKKQQQAQVYVIPFFSIFMHIFLSFNNYNEFLMQSH